MPSRRWPLIAALMITLSVIAPAWAQDAAVLARGGRLYDDWMRESGEKPPAEPAPGAAALPPSVTQADAWRCVTCHGWAYSGAHGQKGIAGMAGVESAAVRARLTAPDHGYGDLLDPADLDALAAFVAHGQSSLMARLDLPSGRVDAPPAPAVVQTICARCHGGDGQQVSSLPPLGEMDSARVLHSVLNGHPGGVMPALRALDDGVVLGVVAAVRDLPGRPRAAILARGGRLYDSWDKELGVQPPDGLHPAWPTGLQAPADARASWRCRACHGWEAKGVAGMTGAATLAGAEPARLSAAITAPAHGFARLLGARDVADLAAFLSAGQTPVDGLIDPVSGRLPGDGAGYATHYQLMCAPCHGPTGTAIRTMPPLARIVHEDPRRALYSVLDGHPGESMPPLRAFPDDLALGILTYAQGLPTKR